MGLNLYEEFFEGSAVKWKCKALKLSLHDRVISEVVELLVKKQDSFCVSRD